MESCGGVLNVILRIRLAFASDDNYRSNGMIGISIAVLFMIYQSELLFLSQFFLFNSYVRQMAVVYLYQLMV